MNIYLDSGYLNIPAIINLGLPFNFVVGGRGTGKTYGALKHVYENNIKFVLMRRSQTQLDIINKPEFSPFKTLNADLGWNVGTSPISKYNVGFYNMETDEKGRAVPYGSVLGYSMALSTISNMRGFDASDVELMIFDEFIPEKHERPIKNEGAAFLNAYETINRNRELKGKKPLQVLALANANDLGNAIFMELRLIAKAERMKRNGQEYSIDRERGIVIFMLNESPISEAKSGTVLYKLSSGSDYSDMALKNDFEEISDKSVKPQPLHEYTPIVNIGELTIYKHKSKNQYYATTHLSGSPVKFGTSDVERERFIRKYAWLYESYMRDKLYFEDSTCEILFNKYYM